MIILAAGHPRHDSAGGCGSRATRGRSNRLPGVQVSVAGAAQPRTRSHRIERPGDLNRANADLNEQ